MTGDPAKPDRDGAEGFEALQRHGPGFLASGLLAFIVDAAVLEIGVRLFGASPLIARIAAIWIAMIVGWLAHRRWTFAIGSKPTAREFLHYAIAGWLAAFINYCLFALQMVFIPNMQRLVALGIASGGSMVFSYIAMRYSVFKRH